MLEFAGDWADEIAEVSTRPEFQNAEIRVFDQSQATETQPYDPVTNTGPVYEGGDIYVGQARVIGVRWGNNYGGESQGNAYTQKSVRVQIPFDAVGRVKKGCVIFFTSVPRNPALEEQVGTVTSDFQGSMAAARTFEVSLSGDSSV